MAKSGIGLISGGVCVDLFSSCYGGLAGKLISISIVVHGLRPHYIGCTRLLGFTRYTHGLPTLCKQYMR